MPWLLNFLLSAAIFASCAYGLYYAWRWALENFNLGHIQLQDLRRESYTEVPSSTEQPNEETIIEP
ncbi:hypothetical protein DASB73_033830 [Starmerella bacillaris]|uniref:ATP synthase F0 subunit 8 n=1 Tax=Starmerella bacillaris TaxID=1247836 RepID=A0AAV5RLK9_STABA|nr:hypothetical protein DASB73_033830 [Starmerella bacillaris]